MYKKLFGYGFLIWVVAYLVAMIFVGLGASATPVMGILVVLATAVLAFYSGRRVEAHSFGRMLAYSLGWVVIGLVLDFIFAVPFTGLAVLYSWPFAIGYLFTLVVPLFAVKRGEGAMAPA